MVYFCKSTRAYTKAFGLCALSVATLSLATAQTSTSTAACEVSDGDMSFGVQVVDDVGCTNGGIGCYNDHCRYCKIVDTPKSTQFESCSSFGANFSTTGTVTDTTGPCEISEGDAAVGIAAVTDADCLYGGLGCFEDHCRFCKLNETPESAAFIECSDLNTSSIVTIGTPDTPAPTVAVTAASSNSSACSFVVSEGDAAVGIRIVTDDSCAGGGVGCIDEVCRYCRVVTTVQSAAFTDCQNIAGANVGTETPSAAPTETPTEIPTEAPSVSGTCQQVASEGDTKAGIVIVSDSSCATGGLGCISAVCRYCRLVYTQQSAAFTECSVVLNSNSTVASDTPSPTPAATIATEVPTEAPTVSADVPATQSPCTQVASSGDASVGISIVSDASCTNGGVGCIDTICRFCKVYTTPQSTSFLNCTSIDGYSTVDTVAPTDAPTDAPTESPVASDASSSSGVTCTRTQSDGDAAAGINIYTDSSCANGGVGCIDDVCRFCKVTSTEQSAAFVDCPNA